MCRLLAYLGDPVQLDQLLFASDNSFIKQTIHPRYMEHLLNLAGFGMLAWEREGRNPLKPHTYKTTTLPFYDDNLWSLAHKINPQCFVAHIRGVSYYERHVVSTQNVHPFSFPGTNVALAHNGNLDHFDKMKFDLLEFVHPDFQKFIQGTTDSEWIYAVFITKLTQLNPTTNYATKNIMAALTKTLQIIQQVRHKHHIESASPVNLCITDGTFVAAVRFVFDYGWLPFDTPPSTHFAYHSLWYTYGENYNEYDGKFQMQPHGNKTSVIIASEPLTQDNTSWIEVPEYTMLVMRKEDGLIEIVSQDIVL